MTRSWDRGHRTLEYWDGNIGSPVHSVYEDTGDVVDHKRACIRCNKLPTVEGYDACLGHIKGAKSVCCGHGVMKPILILEDNNEV